MKEIHLLRKTAGADGTRGFLYIEGYAPYPTIEPSPVQGKGAIPAGRYGVGWTYSPRFKKPLPLLYGVPNFEGIRIHGGCRKEHTQGCICIPLERVNEVYRYVEKNVRDGHRMVIVVHDVGESLPM